MPRNIISALLGVLILYLSLTEQDAFDNSTFLNIPHFDKIVHFGMYFCLMFSIIFENRKKLDSKKHLLFSSFIPFIYGISMEIMQMTLTTTRSGSVIDVIFNLSGIIASVLLWIQIRNRYPNFTK